MEIILFTKKNKNNVNDAIEGEKSYKKLTSEEWHQFVQNYNYDSGNEPFEWLIKQKICDKGTALCLYWHLQPDFYCNFWIFLVNFRFSHYHRSVCSFINK
ncbi:DUF4274 domain-containing protein [Sphingobacterium sp. ML3W]|uniref:DUF4274 domain-containing protein n=1 Tax=Sphingobacterium sp. ML3W TaxID=1538644 RepID=UPI00384DE361